MMKSSLLTFVGHVLQIHQESRTKRNEWTNERIRTMQPRHDRHKVKSTEIEEYFSDFFANGRNCLAIAMIYENFRNVNPFEFNFVRSLVWSFKSQFSIIYQIIRDDSICKNIYFVDMIFQGEMIFSLRVSVCRKNTNGLFSVLSWWSGCCVRLWWK